MPDTHWQELSAQECYDLLRTHTVGRLALVEGGLPLILPVNYVLDGAAVVFRTAPGSKLDAALRAAPVAFEIDGVDVSASTGWSVLVRGRAEHVVDSHELTRLARLPLAPLAPGAKPHLVRVLPVEQQVTGRRISAAGIPANWWG